jgi:hypothetical protein
MEIKVQEQPAVIDRLEKLGFKAASSKVKELSIKKRKMAIAYEHYRFVRPEKIEAFNRKLEKESRRGSEYKTLSFTPVESYSEVPPGHVLEKMEAAVDRKCFDQFEVAHIINVKDPILFGRIHGCPDRFFIDQWDDDVRIEDILKPNEG